jgi:hypothetical protein
MKINETWPAHRSQRMEEEKTFELAGHIPINNNAQITALLLGMS